MERDLTELTEEQLSSAWRSAQVRFEESKAEMRAFQAEADRRDLMARLGTLNDAQREALQSIGGVGGIDDGSAVGGIG